MSKQARNLLKSSCVDKPDKETPEQLRILSCDHLSKLYIQNIVNGNKRK